MSDPNCEFRTRLRESRLAAEAAVQELRANKRHNAETDEEKRLVQEMLKAMEAYRKALHKEIEFRKLNGIDGPSQILT